MKKAKFWFKNEKEVMRSLGFEPVKGSGSGWIHKEDGESEFALAQLKSTEAESYRVNYLDIEKLEYHASVSHKLPVFVIEFLNRGTYLMFNVNDLCNLYQFLVSNKIEMKEREIEYEEGAVKRERVKSSKNDRYEFYQEREKKWRKQSRKIIN